MKIPPYTDTRPTCVLDTECFPNYWSIAFRCVETGRTRRFSMHNDSELDRAGIAKVIRNWRVVGFNSNNYDIPMLCLAMNGASNRDLKKASDGIILADIRPWQFYELHGVNPPEFLDHIDLMEVSPGSPTKPSLKIYAGRLHSKTMRDLPFEIDRVLTDEDIPVLEEYHDIDLDDTKDFYFELKPQIELRAQMSVTYGVDLRSKSDAQVAEAVIKAEIERLTRQKLYRPDVKPGAFRYRPPRWVKFQTPMMQDMLKQVSEASFVIRSDGQVLMPKYLEEADIPIGDGVYRMGIGGLHSSENRTVHVSDDDFIVCDNDVTSYYPSIILNEKLYPRHIGESFLKIYRSIFDRRVAAKKAGNKTVAETLKIVLNGSFGKFGSPYSVLYSPDLMIQTTVTGQLAILMLIEELDEMRGIQVVSANTDGFVSKVPVNRRSEFQAVLKEWEWHTGFGTEETRYDGLYSRDVNNYVAIGSDGKVKTKGALALGGPGQPGAAGMKKNPTNEVCIEAVIAYLKDKTPIEQTIRACTDIRKFVTIRRVNGGAHKNGEKIGKAIRFYYAEGVEGTIKYITSGNDVPKTEGAKPLMTLPDEFPDDVCYGWYVREATAILQDIGITVIDPAFEGRKGTTYARLGEQKTVHTVRLPHGEAECGKRPDSIREKWVEVRSLDGERYCSKCRKVGEL